MRRYLLLLYLFVVLTLGSRPRRVMRMPQPPGGPFVLNPDRGWFSVILPVARTNLVINPSFETNATSWTVIGAGSIAVSTTYQAHGAYSLAITPTATTTDGARYDTVSLTSGTTYAYSCKFRGVANLKYKICIETTGASELTNATFIATGKWQWVWGYYTETASTTRRFTVRKVAHASTAVFYIDGVQVEAIAAGETVSTYIDGDQLGLIPNQQPPAYYWAGTPHASQSSRSGQTRAGGMVVNLQDVYRFNITGFVGLGMAVPTIITTPHGQLDGEQFQRETKQSRRIVVNGTFGSRGYGEYQRNFSDLSQALDRDRIGADQPIILRYQAYDRLRELGGWADAIVKYAGGLDGDVANHFSETVGIGFTQFTPDLIGLDAGATLNVQTSVTSANYILKRATNGQWSAVSSGTVNGASGAVSVITIANDGKVYVGGVFATASGVANTSRICYYDPSDGLFHAMGTGAADNEVTSIVIGPDGTVYAGGTFTAMGGVGSTKNIAKWNGAAWSAMGSGVTTGANVYALAVDATGNVYAGGAYTVMGGVANTVRIAKWDGSAWNALSTGANDNVRALAVTPSGTLYLGGDFTTIGGVSAALVASWNGSAFSALGTGLGATCFALGVGLDLRLYASGSFTTAGGVSASHVAVWNGSSWAAMGDGLNSDARRIAVAPDGSIWFGGSFTLASGAAPPAGLVRWNGSSFVPVDCNLVSATNVQAVAFDRAGNMYAGYDTFGTAVQAGLTTVTSSGTARAYPNRVVIKGPASGTSRVYMIINDTTNRAIYLNYTINAGETAILDATPDNVRFVSDFQGSLMNKIMPGSQQSDFFLQNGANNISVYTAVSTCTAVMSWRTAYKSAADVID